MSISHEQQSRILSLDVVRGVAVLGILLMNIQSFAFPEAVYSNPTAYGDFSGLNLGIWLLSHLFIDGKFILLFSLLFGAGMLLFSERLEQRGLSASPFHYRRMAALAFIGLIHAYLVWEGDILFTYAVCGAILYSFRHASARQLFTAGLLIQLLWCGLNWLGQSQFGVLPPSDQFELVQFWAPDSERLADEIATQTGPWWNQFLLRAERSFAVQTENLIWGSFWLIGSYLLLGMAVYKSGLLHRSLSRNHLLLAAVAGAIGFALMIWETWYSFAQQWDWRTVMVGARLITYLAALFMAFAYLVGLIWLSQRSFQSMVTQRLAAVGRLAFSNYLSQSLICTLLFYGHGLGWFATLQRWQLLIIVVSVWALQLWWSPLWLRHFRQGPMEFIWRRMTYGRTFYTKND